MIIIPTTLNSLVKDIIKDQFKLVYYTFYELLIHAVKDTVNVFSVISSLGFHT